MNSRDRIRDTPLARALEAKFEDFLSHNGTLRELQNQRRRAAIHARLEDDKPLADVLQGLMRDNPTLSKLLLQGLNVSAPFPPGTATGGSKAGTAQAFVGKRFPTYFRFKDRRDGEVLKRSAQITGRTRVAFETDAEDDYFVREVDPGAWNVSLKTSSGYVPAGSWNTTGPRDGIAQLWFDNLPHGVAVGDELDYVIEVTDPSRLDAFEDRLLLDVVPATNGGSGPGGASRNANAGKGRAGGSGSTLALPHITLVEREAWVKHDFDELSVLQILHSGTEADPQAPVFDFFVNVDNRFLLAAQKEKIISAELIRQQFVYGFVLVGLALIQDRQHAHNAPSDGLEDFVGRTSKALGPILVPMIEAIGSLGDE